MAGGLPGARVHGTGQELVQDDAVDAVVVTSWPLATTQEACLRILAAEAASGRRLVQVGYMRRYDLHTAPSRRSSRVARSGRR